MGSQAHPRYDLGGVTRDILVQTTLPVLMPHWVHSTPYGKLS